MSRLSKVLLVAVLLACSSACTLSLRNPQIADLRHNPGRYQDRTVHLNGVVTSSWGVPLVPYRFYKIDDGSGELTVLSQSLRTPTKGARVHVKGRVGELAVFAGEPIGLHLREEKLDVKRN